MRSDDLGARIGYNRFAVAVMRCPADKASIIGQRIVHNASQVTIIGNGLPVTFNLKDPLAQCYLASRGGKSVTVSAYREHGNGR